MMRESGISQNKVKLLSNIYPEPIMGLESGTWAHSTITERFPQICRRVIEENDYPQRVIDKLDEIIQEIPHNNIRLILDPMAVDESDWNSYIRGYLECNWLQVPWFFAEHYFYRRIIEAVGYFSSRYPVEVDPFLYQKRLGLEISRDQLLNINVGDNNFSELITSGNTDLEFYINIALWANQADLSLWPAKENANERNDEQSWKQDRLLIDDSHKLIQYILKGKDRNVRIDILADNAGYELVCDLALANFLLENKFASKIVFHLKSHPTFVSDALISDFLEVIQELSIDGNIQIRGLGLSLKDHYSSGNLLLKDNTFWTSPLEFWKLSGQLRRYLERSSLVVCKGDANYRRLLGDRHWSLSDKFSHALSHFKAPLVALRTLKSELIIDLPVEKVKGAQVNDPQWMVDGQWGIIQFYNPLEKSFPSLG